MGAQGAEGSKARERRAHQVVWPRIDRSSEGRELSESDEQVQGLRDRLSTAGEEALGEVTQALLENPVFNQVLATTLGAGERALAAQRSAMSALNVPSASDVERIERRLRLLSGRLEDVEDRLDEIADELAALPRSGSD
jgi:hypothetical protein